MLNTKAIKTQKLIPSLDKGRCPQGWKGLKQHIELKHTQHILFALLSLLVLTSCGQKEFDTEEALWEYLKDESNGYQFTKTINGVDFSLIYRPTDLLVKQELNDSNNAEQIAKLRDKYGKYMYFNLSMSKESQELLSTAPGNQQEFGAMVNQLAFGMGEKVHLYTQKKDTIALADYVYPRMYGMSQSTTMMFVYPKDENKIKGEYLNLTIEDLGLMTGEVKFKIPIDPLKDEPHLNLNRK